MFKAKLKSLPRGVITPAKVKGLGSKTPLKGIARLPLSKKKKY